MTEWLESCMGMPWPLAMAVVATTLMLADLFFCGGDILSYIADVLYAGVVLHFIPTNNWIWLALWAVVVYLAVLLGHLLVWRKFLGFVVDRCIAPDREKSLNERLLGRTGEVTVEQGQLFIHIDDEFLRCLAENADRLPEERPFMARIIRWDAAREIFVIAPVAAPGECAAG